MLLESAGFGLFAHLRAVVASKKLQERPAFAGRKDKLRYVLNTSSEILLDYRAPACRTLLDGSDYSGRYLFAEMMNVRTIGLHIALTPDVDPGDGASDVILLTEDDRPVFADYLQKRLTGTEAALHLKGLRAKDIVLACPEKPQAHIDDELLSIDRSAALEVKIKPHALRFL